MTQEQIDALDDFENGPFNEAEKAGLRFASKMALTDAYGEVDDGLWAQMQEHYSDAQIAELAVVLCVDVGWAKMLFTLDWAEKEPYCYYHPPEERKAEAPATAAGD